jgi:hypothetical protein
MSTCVAKRGTVPVGYKCSKSMIRYIEVYIIVTTEQRNDKNEGIRAGAARDSRLSSISLQESLYDLLALGDEI